MLYRVKEITPSLELEPLLQRLPEWRRQQAQKFKFPLGKLECALSYLLLQELLEEEFGYRCEDPFALGEHGKPYLPNHPEIHFNISHCKQAVAGVVSREGEVGIDIESRGRYSDSLAEYVLNEEELSQVKQAPDPDLEFTRLWTKKEALLKQQGTGITDNLKEVLKTQDSLLSTHDYRDFVMSVTSLSPGLKK